MGAHLMNTKSSDTEVYYWRHETKVGERDQQKKITYEVDFVMVRGRDMVAIEVKSGSKRCPDDRKGLVAFHERYSKVNRYGDRLEEQALRIKSYLVGLGGDVSLEEFFSRSASEWCSEAGS